MPPLTVPEAGLTLLGSPTPTPESKNESKPLQIMQLDLADGVLEEIVKCARHGGKSMNVSFGKTITLHYGSKSQKLTSIPSSSHSLLYDYPTQNETDLALAGRMSHRLAMQKAKEETAGADEALTKLQSQLASHEKAKQSMQIKYVPDSSTLPPPVKQTAAAFKKRSMKTNPLSFPKKDRLRLNHDTTRSMPVSPSLGAQLPLSQTSSLTSVPSLPSGRTQRLQALRTPLIHFLAARPASTKLLTEHLGCKQDEVLEVLQKVGKPFRLDASKWDLTDKMFKELDVWNFNYPNQEDRELAIGRARSAFDRMRVSTQEKIWDKLLPKNERGQGKILSHLNLHKGPIQKPTTPKIHIQHSSNDSRAQKTAGEESDQKDRLAPSDAEPMARSKSHGPIKRTKVSEKEAQSKRLLSNGPKKITSTPKPKESHPAVKKGGPLKKPAPKSSEFVNDSDEEDGLDDAATDSSRPHTAQNDEVAKKTTKTTNPPTSTTASIPANPKVNGIAKDVKPAELPKPSSQGKMNTAKASSSTHAKAESQTKPAVTKDGKETKTEKKAPAPAKVPEKRTLASGASTPVVKHRTSESSPGPTAMKKTLSRQRTTSSPHKPSPLGSSPPTNASDLDNPGRTSDSSSSLSTQGYKSNVTPNGIGLGINGHTRNSSDHVLKRKAGDLNSGLHNHSSPLTNGVINSYINGCANGMMGSAKRQKTSEKSPSSESGDELLGRGRNLALNKARDYKKYYAHYAKQYREISQMTDAPQERVDEVMKMHRRLAELKDQITEGLFGL